MNSSTSNFDAPGSMLTEPARGAAWKIAVFLVIVFVLLEIFTRGFLFPRSKDFVRFKDYPAKAEHLVQQPGLRLAFVGNSATQRGLDPKLLEDRLPTIAGQPVPLGIFVADASSIDTWCYMVKHLFWSKDLKPDWLLIHFFGGGLDDDNQFEIGRIALFFTDASDWQDLVSLDLRTTSDRLDYLLSTRWATFAARDRLRSRALGLIVPDYKAFAEELNESQVREQKRNRANQELREKPPKTFRALDRFLMEAIQHQTKVCFVAFPTMPPVGKGTYELEPEALKRIADAGMEFLDLRRVPELKPEDYADDIHLTEAGAKVYTKKFMEAFGHLISKK